MAQSTSMESTVSSEQSNKGNLSSTTASSNLGEDVDHLQLQESLVCSIENIRDQGKEQKSVKKQLHYEHQQSANYVNALRADMHRLMRQDSRELKEFMHVERIDERHRTAASLRLQRKARERQLREEDRQKALTNNNLFQQRRQEQQERIRAARDRLTQKAISANAERKKQRGEHKGILLERKDEEYKNNCSKVLEVQKEKPSVQTKKIESVLQKVESRKQGMDGRVQHLSNTVQKDVDWVKDLEQQKQKMCEKVQNAISQRQALLEQKITGSARTERSATLTTRSRSTTWGTESCRSDRGSVTPLLSPSSTPGVPGPGLLPYNPPPRTPCRDHVDAPEESSTSTPRSDPGPVLKTSPFPFSLPFR